MKIWREVGNRAGGAWDELPPHQGKITMEFANGWSVSVIAQSYGLSSCLARETARPSNFGVGPQEAFDGEVVEWLAQVMLWKEPK